MWNVWIGVIWPKACANIATCDVLSHVASVNSMDCRARYCQGNLPVRMSVCNVEVSLSYTFRLEFCEVISRLISLTFSLSADPKMTDLLQRNAPPNFSRNRSGVGKIVDFRHLSRHISKTVQDRSKLLLTTNRNMDTRFGLVPKLMTLNDLWARFKVIDSLNAAKWRNAA